MAEPTVDVRRNLHMAYQHVVICGPDETVQAALIAVEDAVAELIEAGRRAEAAIMAWRHSGKPAFSELHAAHSGLIVALARVGGAK